MISPNNEELIGTVQVHRLPYYDAKKKAMGVKARPILVIQCENKTGSSDLTVLPISKVSDRKRVIKGYDIEVSQLQFPNLKLKEAVSFVRTSKVTTVHNSGLGLKEISNLKKEYPELFDSIIEQVKKYAGTF